MSTANPSKRHATIVVNRADLPHENGQKNSSSKDTNTEPDVQRTRDEIASRSVVLLNVPDTVNDARIKELMQRYGTIVKVTLRPDHQGAVVEYKDVPAAGKASLGVEGHEILPGRALRVGTFDELKAEKAEFKEEKAQPPRRKSSEPGASSATMVQPTIPIRRPGQRGGRRGGLGVRRGNLSDGAGGGGAAINGSSKTSRGETSSRSNADFKAMFVK